MITGAGLAHSGPEGVPGTWVTVLDEDFSGGSLDRDRWQPNRYGKDGGDAPFNPAEEAAWFSGSNVTVSDGMLELTIQEQPRTLDDRDYPFSSGVVQASSHISIGPNSYVEARVEVPRCDGCWPAFWLIPTDVWPPEIDGFEFFDTGKRSESRPSFNYHLPNGDATGPSPYGRKGVDYRDGFHTYGILWQSDSITPYVDGVAYPQVAATRAIAQREMTLILNLSVMADHDPKVGSRMRVDWVRVWVPAPWARPFDG
jgi:beta-glucanase (GH16 family)